MPKVFISYSHDSDEHRQRVLELSNRLRREGVDCFIDQYVNGFPPEGWKRWMEDQIENADFVLLVCTETYLNRFRGKDRDGGRGVNFEGVVISQTLYDSYQQNSQFIAVMPDNGSFDHVPAILKGFTTYLFSAEYEALYRVLTNQPLVDIPEVGEIVDLSKTMKRESLDLQKLDPLSALKSHALINPPKPPHIKLSLGQLPVPPDPIIFTGRDSEMEALTNVWNTAEKNIVQLVSDGGVGKSMIVWKWLEQLQMRGYPDVKQVFDWSFFSQGSNSYISDSQDFLDSAYQHFEEYGLTLAKHDRKLPTKVAHGIADAFLNAGGIIVLDGIEPLQSPKIDDALVLDDGVYNLLKIVRNSGSRTANDPKLLLIVTTRWRIPELKGNAVETILLEPLSPSAGARLLRELTIPRLPKAHIFFNGADTVEIEQEFEKASEEYGGHALALFLLGSYLLHHFDGNLAMRSNIPMRNKKHRLFNVDPTSSLHADRILTSYDRLFADRSHEPIQRACRQVLRLLSLFDRPVSTADLAVVAEGSNKIAGLTDNLQPKLLNEAIRELKSLGLVTTGTLEHLCAHPLLLAHFETTFRRSNEKGWRDAHGLLFRHYSQKTIEYPNNLNEMQPLFLAIVHGCKAGKQKEAINDIYIKRMMRGNNSFAYRSLGAVSPLLSALSHFFEPPDWSRYTGPDDDDLYGFVLNQVSAFLRALDRTDDAEQVLVSAIQFEESRSEWFGAGSNIIFLYELLYLSGRLSEALEASQKLIGLTKLYKSEANRRLHETLSYFQQAGISHARGQFEQAERQFGEAEQIWKKLYPEDPYLSGYGGFLYNSLLIDQGQSSVALKRAYALLPEAVQTHVPMNIGLYKLCIARARALEVNYLEDIPEFDESVAEIRQSGEHPLLLHALLARAYFKYRREPEKIDSVLNDLAEVIEISERAGYLLFYCDARLRRARVLLDHSIIINTGSIKLDLPILDRDVVFQIIQGQHSRQRNLKDAYHVRLPEFLLLDALIAFSQYRNANLEGNIDVAEDRFNETKANLRQAKKRAFSIGHKSIERDIDFVRSRILKESL